MRNLFILLLCIFIFSANNSCKERIINESKQTQLVAVKTTRVVQGDIENSLRFNGKTVYLKKNTIVAPIAAYIKEINVKFGDAVQNNDVLFVLQTKENKALENTDINKESYGIIKVLASSGGIISELNISETGAFIVEGGSLCSIVENKDMMVQVNVPFEYNHLLKKDKECEIFLSDNTTFYGSFYKILPIMNEEDQTQLVLIKPNTKRMLPENLNLIVQFVNAKSKSSNMVAKDAILTNETQTEFWVMKIIDDTVAVKIPVLKGIENDSQVEISSPDLKLNDILIREGAYGLPDTIAVKIIE